MTTSTLPAPLWKAAEAAVFLGVHVDDLYRMAAAGEVPARRFGTRWRFVPSELEAAGRYEPAERPEVPARPVPVADSPTPPVPQSEPVAVRPPARPRGGRRTPRQQLADIDPYADLKAS